MNSITSNSISSYNSNYINNATNVIQATQNDTATSNTSMLTKTSDTSEISNDYSSNSYGSFVKIVREVSSETEKVSCSGGYMSADVAFFIKAESMKLEGYNVPSVDNSMSSYSNFIDKMKNYISNDHDTDSNSNYLINFCDNLQERLKTYGIN